MRREIEKRSNAIKCSTARQSRNVSYQNTQERTAWVATQVSGSCNPKVTRMNIIIKSVNIRIDVKYAYTQNLEKN